MTRKYDFLYEEETYKEIPCQVYCPVHTDIQEYIHRVSEADWVGAHSLILDTNPFPSICGRVCQHPCEDGCNRNKLDDSVSIRSLKRAATDFSAGLMPDAEPVEPTLEKIAIVGAGPAGLTAANDLCRLGYKVTVYEAEAFPGGMLRYGIPAYRLPRETIDKEVEWIQQRGVDIKYNTRVGKDITLEQLQKDNTAVLMAAGAWTPARLNVEGEELDGVYHGSDFMFKVNTDDPPSLIGKKVVVIGGGFTSMDVSRSSVRLGAEEVHIVYRRTRNEMPVVPQEIIEAEEEGIHIHYLVSPLEVVSDDGKTVTGLKMIKNELGEPDSSGRRRPLPIEGSEYVMECDLVVPAVSQAPDNECLTGQKGIRLSNWGTIVVDEKTFETNIPGIYACGDFTVGTQHVIKVIAEGHHAAVAIDTYIRGEPAEKAIKERQDFVLLDAEEPQDKAPMYDEIIRQHSGVIDIKQRLTTFSRGGDRPYPASRHARSQAMLSVQLYLDLHTGPMHHVRKLRRCMPGRLSLYYTPYRASAQPVDE